MKMLYFEWMISVNYFILTDLNLAKQYIKITRENLCHRYSPRGKSFEPGIVPVARYSHQLSSVLFKNS
jgi:hypothetical protein